VSPTGIAYVADGNNNRVETFSPTGVSQSTFGTSGSGNGQFSDPSGVAVSSSGTVCVADQINIRVEIFGSTDWTNAASERSLCDIAN
jgi:DNA-binding beta-propeller fold protein YncE